MIEPDDTIRFDEDDVPEQSEIQGPKGAAVRHEEPEPEDWRPFGIEW